MPGGGLMQRGAMPDMDKRGAALKPKGEPLDRGYPKLRGYLVAADPNTRRSPIIAAQILTSVANYLANSRMHWERWYFRQVTMSPHSRHHN